MWGSTRRPSRRGASSIPPSWRAHARRKSLREGSQGAQDAGSEEQRGITGGKNEGQARPGQALPRPPRPRDSRASALPCHAYVCTWPQPAIPSSHLPIFPVTQSTTHPAFPRESLECLAPRLRKKCVKPGPSTHPPVHHYGPVECQAHPLQKRRPQRERSALHRHHPAPLVRRCQRSTAQSHRLQGGAAGAAACAPDADLQGQARARERQ